MKRIIYKDEEYELINIKERVSDFIIFAIDTLEFFNNMEKNKSWD